MKPKIVLLALICVIVFNNCSKNSDPVSPNPNTFTGVILLKIDRENAPASVTLIEATLSRTGYDSIFAFLNLLSDSSAQVTLEDIPAGVWHLQVDAKDSVGEVLYTGQTDVEILAGFIVQVHLTLYPTGLGTGGIYIFVTWGSQPPGNWTDYSANPIFSGNQSPLNPSFGVRYPRVLFENGVYKLWFNNLFNGSVSIIGYAESSNGYNWSALASVNPALAPGPIGTWDSKSVVVGAVFKDGNTYYMYYTGYEDLNSFHHVGLATSTDGIFWSKHNLPVLYGNTQEPRITVDDVIKIENTFYMYYSIINVNSSNPYSIGLAISSDGYNWTRYSGNPILLKSASWENAGVYAPSVIRENNQFKMVYMNSSASGFGIANSADGKNWTKESNNPFFNLQMVSNNWTTFLAYPNWRKFGTENRIYYTGGSNSYNKIGVLIK